MAICWVRFYHVDANTHFILHILYLKKLTKTQASLFCNFIVVHKLYSVSHPANQAKFKVAAHLSTAAVKTAKAKATMQTTCHGFETSYTFDKSHGKYFFTQGLSFLWCGELLEPKQARNKTK